MRTIDRRLCPPRPAPAGHRGEEGFTLLEAVVAILLLFVALTGMLEAVSLQQKQITKVEQYARARGVVDLDRGRAVVTVFEGASGGQTCEVRLATLEIEDEALTARVQTGDPGTLPAVMP